MERRYRNTRAIGGYDAASDDAIMGSNVSSIQLLVPGRTEFTSHYYRLCWKENEERNFALVEKNHIEIANEQPFDL